MLAKLVMSGEYYEIPWAIEHCLCSDGQRRYARITNHEITDIDNPIEACVYVQGKGVTGVVVSRMTPGDEIDWAFTAYPQNKNGYLLPGECYRR